MPKLEKKHLPKSDLEKEILVIHPCWTMPALRTLLQTVKEILGFKKKRERRFIKVHVLGENLLKHGTQELTREIWTKTESSS